jgi:hypothetical protein
MDLESLDKSKISTFETIASFIFQATVILSFFVRFYLPYRIMYITFSLAPLIQLCYIKTHKNAAKWSQISNCQTWNLTNFNLILIFFPGITMDPYSVYYYPIFIMLGQLININLTYPLIVESIWLKMRQMGLNLLRWTHGKAGTLLIN